MSNEKTVRVTYGAAGSVLQTEVFNVGEERFGYKVDDPEFPGCFKMYYGRKTVIVPLINLGLLELNL